MKNIIITLVMFLALVGISNGADNFNKIDVNVVYENEFVLDTSEADTIITGIFPIYCDSLSFVAEIVDADSINADGALTSIDARIRFLTPRGIADTTAYANLDKVIDKTAAAGNAYLGNAVTLTSARRGGRARLEINVKNTNDGLQKVKIRIFAIKEWR